MSDLISRKDLIEFLDETVEYEEMLVNQYNADWIYSFIESAPSVDAAEVVRCKECRYYHPATGWCTHHSHFIGANGEACHPWESAEWKMLQEDDFCSYGESKEKGDGRT